MKTKNYTTSENSHKKSVRLVCLSLAILIVLGSLGVGLTALVGAFSGSKLQNYPPIFIYDDNYYMVVDEIVSALPAEVSAEVTLATMGTQDDLPNEPNTANFGKNEVTVSALADGTLYYHAPDGTYLKCMAVLQEEETSE